MLLYKSNHTTSTIEAMLRQEEKGYSCKDYLHQQQSFEENTATFALHNRETNSNNREKMIDWYYQIAECCHFNSNTMAIATSCLDRFLATKIGSRALVDSKYFQLAGLTALYIAVKIYEVEVMDPKILSKLSQGLYTKDDIEKMERKILSALEWRVNPPTALAFVREFLEIIPSFAPTNGTTMNGVYELSRIQIELALRNNRSITIKNSTIAFASLMNSLNSVSNFNTQTIELIGCHISKITRIDWCSEDFKNTEYLIHANIDKESCINFKCITNFRPRSIGNTKESTKNSCKELSTSENSPRSLTKYC